MLKKRLQKRTEKNLFSKKNYLEDRIDKNVLEKLEKIREVSEYILTSINSY